MPPARKAPPAGAPWLPPKWDVADAGALQALARGEADSHAQRRALDWLINAACGTYDLSFHPDSDRATSFAEGRRFVGLQTIKLIKLNLSQYRTAKGGAPDEQH